MVLRGCVTIPISSMNTLSDDCRKLKKPLLFALSSVTVTAAVVVAGGVPEVTFVGATIAAAVADLGTTFVATGSAGDGCAVKREAEGALTPPKVMIFTVDAFPCPGPWLTSPCPCGLVGADVVVEVVDVGAEDEGDLGDTSGCGCELERNENIPPSPLLAAAAGATLLVEGGEGGEGGDEGFLVAIVVVAGPWAANVKGVLTALIEALAVVGARGTLLAATTALLAAADVFAGVLGLGAGLGAGLF